MRNLSIVICCYNKYNFTKACLDDLSKLPNDHEIILIDDGSTDETYSKLKDSKEIKYIRNETNIRSFAKNCNKGYLLAESNNVLFLNNDIRVRSNHSSWTKELIDNCHVGLVGPTMGVLDKDFNFIKEDNKILSGNSYMSGWCLASTKDNWEKLNLRTKDNPEIFSEEFGFYFEDTDLSFRAKKLDIKFHIVDIPVIHFGRTSSKELNTRELYLSARSKFVKKWKK